MDSSSHWLLWLSYTPFGLLPLAVFYDFASVTDVILLFSIALFRSWKSAFQILQFYNLQLFVRIAVGVAAAFALARTAKWLGKRPGTNTKSTDDGPKPLFFPSRTTHTRFFPKIHSFSYSYLLVGIPVGWQGSVGGMISADQGTYGTRIGFQDNSSSSSWYTVDAADYLDRGYRHLGLDGKLRKFIQSQVCFYHFPLGSEVDSS
jgi:hypothetical protein